MSTINATLSNKAIHSSYTGSEESPLNKLSDTEEPSIAYIKVKTNTLETCNNTLKTIVEKVNKQFNVELEINLINEGKYNGYFKIISESPDAIEFSKSLLLETENQHKNN